MRKAVDFIKLHQNDNWLWLGLICIACSLLMLAFPILGIPDGYDVTQHLRFAATYKEAILESSFVPSWASVDNLGFGGVGVRFYPPFADYLLAITQIFTNDWYQTLWLNSFFWMFPGCIGVYFWVKEFRSPNLATFAAIVYALIPYHLLQIYRFQLYSEFVASAILPICFLFITKLIKRGSVTDVLGLSVSCSLLLLTHIPSSLIGFTGLGLYAAIVLDWKAPFKTIRQFAVAMMITLASASFYLVRLFTEVEWVKHNTAEFSTGFYDHRRHFFPIIYNFGELYYVGFMWLLDLSILFTLVILLPLIFFRIWLRSTKSVERIERKMVVAVSVTGLFSIFMLSSVSAFLWDKLPVLQKLQFPWRYLSVASLMGAVSLTFAISLLLERYRRLSRLVIYSTTALILVMVLFDLTQTIMMAGPLTREKFYEMVVNKRGDEGCSCWWPIWAERGAFNNREGVSAGNRGVDIAIWGPATREFAIEKGSPMDVRVATFYYPFWKAVVNEKAVEVKMDENGVILIPISADAAKVRIYFEEPLMNKIALYISLVTWIFLLFAVSILLGKKFLSTLKRSSALQST